METPIGNKQLSTQYHVECIKPDGTLRWAEDFHNLVTTAGLNDSLDKHFKGSSYTAAWYVGLVDDNPTFNAADTMGSHAGWTEADDYDEATREVLTLGTPAAGSVDNSASKASFTMSATVVIAGVFLTTVSTKNGTTGVLYGEGAFTGGDRSCQDNDTLNVTVTLTASAS